ncbi:MAG TPA: hypothetical protein VFE84_02295, partial [Patescibacteria group bacterium]|nr:hypothetical protein [Patescibacteria group bacterium]
MKRTASVMLWLAIVPVPSVTSVTSARPVAPAPSVIEPAVIEAAAIEPVVIEPAAAAALLAR